MMSSKWVGRSKTVLASLVVIGVQAAPFVGIEFGPEEGAMVNSAFDSILSIGAAAFAIYGRVSAVRQVYVMK